MSNIYPKAKERALGAGLALTSSSVKVALIDTAQYTYNASHEFLSSVPAGAIVGTSPALTSVAVTNGVVGAANVTVTAVTGPSTEALLIYVDTGSAATSRLVAFIDAGAGLPFTPNGSDLTISWNGGTIFTL